MSEGMLSISDLSIWLGRSRAAVNTWVKGRVPLTVYMPELESRLARLEAFIAAQEGKPLVPHSVSMMKRKTYILGLFNDALASRTIPEPDTSRARVVVRVRPPRKAARLGKNTGGTKP